MILNQENKNHIMDYKDTLNLPKTKFPMRGNLANREPITLHRWYENNLYKIIRENKKYKKKFILHDGPPYANGNIHIGHSVNKILKDIIIKSKGFMGYDSPYIPGWDCHGLPIELKVEKIVGRPGEKISSSKFRSLCRKYATEQITSQKNDFIRLGILGDWDHPYLAMDFVTEANVIRALGKIVENGHLDNISKPVHWCTDCRSSLAEAELEYCDFISPSVYIAFSAFNRLDIIKKFRIKDFTGPISLIVWSTTLWTLPANRAISLNPDFEYQLIEIKGEGWILATDLVDSVMKTLNIKHKKTLGILKGRNLEHVLFWHPFMNFTVPVILGKHVKLDIGTGAVHIAPGHGPEDYILGYKYGLEIANLVKADGSYLPGTHKDLDGLKIFNANNIIVNLLKERRSLVNIFKINHSYPHCWRHNTPTIFRSTPQWFISMDNSGLRDQALENIKNVQWIPNWGQVNITNMIKNRPDWCISRQRTWGVPISLFIHKDTGILHPKTLEIIEEVANRVEINGIQAWWDLDKTQILGDDSNNYIKVKDTLDVWFDSGSTHFSVVSARPEFNGCLPDMYLEGSDQHRGWFMSSLIISTAMKRKAPYRQVLTHGFVVDGQNKKMSKSLGNVISPRQVIEKFGVDVLRLWAASTDYTGEIAISDAILKRSSDTYRRIRNTARFLLSSLNGFDPSKDSVSKEKMVILDRWAIGRTNKAQKEIISFYNCYDFHSVVKRIMQFCSIEMGAFYLDIIKDRQYTSKSNGIARRSCQTAMYHIIEALVRWIAPILSFTADEIWQCMPETRSQFIFTEEWYKELFDLDDSHIMNNNFWNTLLKIRSEINKIVEQARIDKIIRSSLESKITIYAVPALAAQLRALGSELHFGLLTSQAIVEDYDAAGTDAMNSIDLPDIKVFLEKADGNKCIRCWHYELDIGHNVLHPKICGRCITNILGKGEHRKFI